MAEAHRRRRPRGVLRKTVQAASGLLQNGHLSGFVSGHLSTGGLKRFCVPGLNCYSCPGALGACPLGALQLLPAAGRARTGCYVLGWLAALGLLAGRFICGWLCLFGLIQELLYRLPVRKLVLPPRLDRRLRRLKYLLLALTVLLLPLILRDEYGVSVPYFCKWLCPAGMLEGGLPLLLLNKALRPAAHWLYAWKALLLALFLAASAVIQRPFCKYVCPLGAFYSLFQRVSLLRLKHRPAACTGCGGCAEVCVMGVDPRQGANGTECIRCGACVSACPTGALSFSFSGRELRKRTAGREAARRI